MKRIEAKCPRCGESIHNLVQVRSEVVDYRVFINQWGGIATTRKGSRDEGEVIHYESPECDEAVCFSFEEAEAILKGGNKDEMQ